MGEGRAAGSSPEVLSVCARARGLPPSCESERERGERLLVAKGTTTTAARRGERSHAERRIARSCRGGRIWAHRARTGGGGGAMGECWWWRLVLRAAIGCRGGARRPSLLPRAARDLSSPTRPSAAGRARDGPRRHAPHYTALHYRTVRVNLQVERVMDRDTFFDVQEALAFGIIDHTLTKRGTAAVAPPTP